MISELFAVENGRLEPQFFRPPGAARRVVAIRRRRRGAPTSAWSGRRGEHLPLRLSGIVFSHFLTEKSGPSITILWLVQFAFVGGISNIMHKWFRSRRKMSLDSGHHESLRVYQFNL